MSAQELEVQEKKQIDGADERTESGRFFVPYTDIREGPDAMLVTMDMPGVDKDSVEVMLEKDVLSVTGRVDLTKYDGLEPLYTEYNVGHFARRFSLSSEIDQDGIVAAVADGVLNLTLPKVKEAAARRIPIG